MKTIDYKIHNLKGTELLCKRETENYETYLEEGMRCKVVNVSTVDFSHGHVIYDLELDVNSYLDWNKNCESSNYYNRDGKANCNAHEAGQYSPVIHFYLEGEHFDDCFEIIPNEWDSVGLDLYEKWSSQYKDDCTFYTYLCKHIVELQKKLEKSGSTE